MSSEDSLDLLNENEIDSRPKASIPMDSLEAGSSASCSPSPSSATKKKTFDFSMIDTTGDSNNLSAALQVEQEFLDFMFSLPQIQKEASNKEKGEMITKQETKQQKPSIPQLQETPSSPKLTRHKSPTRTNQLPGNASLVGLEHLDNLCRMMEQLGDLKEQNCRLQRRVQYLEDLKTLQEMHKDMEGSIGARKHALSLGCVSLSDSDLRLEELSSSRLYHPDSEESLELSVASTKSEGKQKMQHRSYFMCTYYIL